MSILQVGYTHQDRIVVQVLIEGAFSQRGVHLVEVGVVGLFCILHAHLDGVEGDSIRQHQLVVRSRIQSMSCQVVSQ